MMLRIGSIVSCLRFCLVGLLLRHPNAHDNWARDTLAEGLIRFDCWFSYTVQINLRASVLIESMIVQFGKIIFQYGKIILQYGNIIWKIYFQYYIDFFQGGKIFFWYCQIIFQYGKIIFWYDSVHSCPLLPLPEPFDATKRRNATKNGAAAIVSPFCQNQAVPSHLANSCFHLWQSFTCCCHNSSSGLLYSHRQTKMFWVIPIVAISSKRSVLKLKPCL